MLASIWSLQVSFIPLSPLPWGTGILKNHLSPAPIRPCLFAAKKFHRGLSLFPATLFASCRVFTPYLYSSPDFNYLANLFNFHREWESENSRSFITAHTGRECFTPPSFPYVCRKALSNSNKFIDHNLSIYLCFADCYVFWSFLQTSFPSSFWLECAIFYIISKSHGETALSLHPGAWLRWELSLGSNTGEGKSLVL